MIISEQRRRIATDSIRQEFCRATQGVTVMAGRDVKEVGQPIVGNRIINVRDLRTVVLPDGLEPTGSFVQKAREHLRSIAGFNGLPAEFEANPRVTKTSSGVAIVHMRQQ